MNYYVNQFQLNKHIYKSTLKKDINKTGLFLIILVLISFVSRFMILIFTEFFNYDSQNYEQLLIYNDTTIFLIANGLISTLTFFLTGLVYCKIVKIRVSEIIPFEKNQLSVIVPLFAMALSIAMLANYASAGIMEIFETFGTDANIDTSFYCDDFFDVILYYITVAVVPACVEEFTFRGIILGSLRKHSDNLAILVSSITFGLIHGNFSQIPFAFIVGLILGYITVKTNSMLPAIIVHFLNNAISVSMSLLVESNNLSTFAINLIYNSIMLIVVLSGIAGTFTLIKKHKGIFKLSSKNNTVSFKEKVLTFCESPTMIIFAVLTLSEAIQTINPGANL